MEEISHRSWSGDHPSWLVCDCSVARAARRRRGPRSIGVDTAIGLTLKISLYARIVRVFFAWRKVMSVIEKDRDIFARTLWGGRAVKAWLGRLPWP
jgi:hypothetical protein